MAPTREPVPAFRLIGLALILVVGALAPALPGATANAHGEALTILAGPYYVPGLPAASSNCGQAAILARPAGNETQVQTVQVQSQGGTGVSQVHFVYDVVADPGTSTAPGLSKAITWIAAQSGGAGWIATVDHGNNAASGPLTFSGTTPGATIPIGTVVKTLNGIEFATVQSGTLQGAIQAEGTVTFTKSASATTNPIIPTGTIVRTTSGLEFRTIQDVQVTGSTASVGVLALQGGAAGNVPAGAITVLATPVTGVQSVTNAAPLAGGKDPSAVVSAVAVEPGTEGNVPAKTVTRLSNPIAGITNVTNAQAMAGGTALKAGDRRVLTFTAQPGSALAGGPGAIFTFAFRVPRSAQGDANGAIPDQYPILVKTTSPSAQGGNKFCIRMDTTAPKLLTAVTRDTDFDGRLDAMELTFNEPLAKDSLVHSQFKVQTRGAQRSYFVLSTSPELDHPLGGCFNGVIPENSVDPNKILEYTPDYQSTQPCARRVVLRMAPGPTFDTGDRPDVTFPASGEGTLTDLGGNRLATLGIGGANTTDGAKPVMVSALAKDGSNKVVVTFSEAITGSGTATAGGFPPVLMDTVGQKGSDFYWKDNCHPRVPSYVCPSDSDPNGADVGSGDCLDNKGSGTNMPRQVAGLSHNPNGNNPNQVIINMGTGSSQYPDRYPKAWGAGVRNGGPPPAAGTNGCTNGTLGAGDTHKTFGDVLGLTVDDTAATCVNTQKKIYDFSPCNIKVKDRAGLRAVAYKTPVGELVVTGVYITEAEVNIDSFRLTVKFNGPVSSAQGDTLGIQLSDIDVVSADDTGRGPSGIVSINHTAGSDQAILTLDHKTRPTDVDDTPARVRVSCAAGRGIKAFGFPGVFVPCHDPDADNKPDVGMVDRTPPSFTPHGNQPAVSTIDADRNGYIDGVKVLFSEPIDDSSFCMGPTTTSSPLPPVTCMGDGFVDAKCDRRETHSILIVDNMPGPYTFDTDLLPNDDQGIIRFPEVPGRLQTTGFTPAITTNPCWSSDAEPNKYRTDSYGNTPFIGKDRGIGLFADQFHPMPSNPPYLVANYMKRVCGEQFGGGTQQNIPYCLPGGDTGSGGGITVKVADGAPPVLWSAKTIDTPIPGQFCTPMNPSGCEGNGKVDGYVLTFSEPVNDCSFRASEWKVAGHNVTGMRTNLHLAGYPAICPPPKYPPQGQGNNLIVLTFDEAALPDTDAKPELTYTGQGACGSCGLRDLNGNAMAAFGSLAIVEEDDAPPVITCVRGFVGRDEITVEFSEPVDNGDRGGLSREDFLYHNNNMADFAGASGLSGTAPVVHKARDKVAYVTLNAPLTGNDMRNDTVAMNVNAAVEVAPTVAVKKPVPTLPHRFCRGVDTVAPGPVQNLQVVAGLTSANSVTLSWTAPGSDDPRVSGEPNGNVTGYRIKIAKEPVTAENFDTTTGAEVVALVETRHDLDAEACLSTNGTKRAGCVPPCALEQVKLTPALLSGRLILRMNPVSCALAHPDQVQRATFLGLEQDTTYHFAVVPFDNATDRDGKARPNFGPMVGNVSAQTRKDATPPGPVPTITAYTVDGAGRKVFVRPFQPTEDRTPLFEWKNATDPESAVTYAYALKRGDDDQNLDYQVRCGTDQPTSLTSFTPQASETREDGVYTLHVAACSAGGQTNTAHYTVVIGAAKIEDQRILNANLRVQTRPIKLGSEYIINWTLPTQAELSQLVPGGRLVGVDIVMLDCDYTRDPPCERRILETVEGNYTQLQTGNLANERCRTCFSNGYHYTNGTAKDPYFRVEMVFDQAQRQPEQSAGQATVRDFAKPVDATPRNEPWPWLIGSILLALVLAAIVTVIVMSSRRKAALQPKAEPPAGIDAETGLPTHDVKCPTCQTPFQAVGTLPLHITCPNCGASGLLQ
jgi:hypothetical protein